ncbi:MAG: hypothetical protein LBE78_03295 [Burkholderiaceae bacterium]|jgi:hypothetical protein|nr:hypothetical protein [Burkholderiaceae bacterium]
MSNEIEWSLISKALIERERFATEDDQLLGVTVLAAQAQEVFFQAATLQP